MHDLSNGWYAVLTKTPEGEAMTLRNPDKGQRIDLAPASVETLRTIFRKAGEGKAA